MLGAFLNNTTMKEQITEKKPYEVPRLTVVSFKTERGYANSNLRDYQWGASQLWGASEPDVSDYSWGNDQSW